MQFTAQQLLIISALEPGSARHAVLSAPLAASLWWRCTETRLYGLLDLFSFSLWLSLVSSFLVSVHLGRSSRPHITSNKTTLEFWNNPKSFTVFPAWKVSCYGSCFSCCITGRNGFFKMIPLTTPTECRNQQEGQKPEGERLIKTLVIPF